MYAFDAGRLVHFRTLAGLSREQVAVAAKVSGPSIVAYENGIRTPRIGVLIALAEAVNVHPAELFVETDDLEAVR